MSTSSMSALLAAVAVVLGIVGVPLVGVLAAVAGASVAAFGVWKGMQEETQTRAAISLLLLLGSLGIAGVLLIWRVLKWLG